MITNDLYETGWRRRTTQPQFTARKLFRSGTIVCMAVLLMVLLCSCGSSSIVGTWQETSEDGHPPATNTTFQFFQDGTVTKGNSSGAATYSLLDGSHLKLGGGLASAVFSYSLDGDQLTMSADGHTGVFHRTS